MTPDHKSNGALDPQQDTTGTTKGAAPHTTLLNAVAATIGTTLMTLVFGCSVVIRLDAHPREAQVEPASCLASPTGATGSPSSPG